MSFELMAPTPAAARPSRRLKERLSFSQLSVGLGDSREAKGSSNVKFIVGGRNFTAHVDILCKVSPVFQQMFKGFFSNEREVAIKDVSPNAFELFLKLIYRGTRSVSIMMTPKDSLDCLLLANRYLITDMEVFLRNKLVRNIRYTNVLSILPYCDLNLDVWSIRSKCWSVIEKDTVKVVKTPQFPRISFNLLCDILENGRLTINEYELFDAVRRWAMHQKKSNKETSLIEILGPAIYKLRFPLMTQAEFNLVKKSGLLRQGEIKDLQSNFRKNTTFPNEPRKNVCQCRKRMKECSICVINTKTSVKGMLVNLGKNERLGREGIPSSSITARRLTRRATVNQFHFRSPRNVAARAGPVSRDDLDINANYLKGRLDGKLANCNSTNNNAGMPDCECFKYKSCPAYPNGTTADILRSKGFTFL